MLVVDGQAQRRAALFVKHEEQVRTSVELDLKLIQRALIACELMQARVSMFVD